VVVHQSHVGAFRDLDHERAIFEIEHTDHIGRVLIGHRELLFRILRHDDADLVRHRAMGLELLHDRLGGDGGIEVLVGLDRPAQGRRVLRLLDGLLVGREAVPEAVCRSPCQRRHGRGHRARTVTHITRCVYRAKGLHVRKCSRSPRCQRQSTIGVMLGLVR